jgi:SAM-dependent methyltransferase
MVGMRAVKATGVSALRAARDQYFASRLARLEARIDRADAAGSATPYQLFHDVSDRLWFYLNTVGYRRSERLRRVLPALPEQETQLRFTGMAGDDTLYEAYTMYALCKRLIERHVGPLANVGNILDYGCGWGRVIRFFLKDVEPSKLWGVDPFAEVLDLAKQTNRWCTFEQIPTMPPTSLPDGAFDAIYLFSVFSHLSEDAHLRLLAEFKRLLRPGGLVIATTRPREFILHCAELRSRTDLPPHLQGGARSFPDTEAALTAYDRGEFCYSPSGGGDLLEESFYGEACIPRRYAENRWGEHFTILDFVDDRALLPQAVVVAKK